MNDGISPIGVHLHVDVSTPHLTVVPNPDGMWSIPPALLDDYENAVDIYTQAVEAILDHVKDSGQQVPWAFTEEAQRVEQLPKDIIDGMQKAAIDPIDNPPIVAGLPLPEEREVRHGITVVQDGANYNAVCICKEATWSKVPLNTSDLTAVQALAESMDQHLIDGGQPAPDMSFYMDLLKYRPKHELPQSTGQHAAPDDDQEIIDGAAPLPDMKVVRANLPATTITNVPPLRPSVPSRENDPDNTEFFAAIRDNDSPLVTGDEVAVVPRPTPRPLGARTRMLNAVTGTFPRIVAPVKDDSDTQAIPPVADTGTDGTTRRGLLRRRKGTKQ